MHASALLERVDQLLGEKQDQKILQILLKQDPAVIAEVIDQLPSGRRKTFSLLPPEIQAQVAVALSDGSKEYIIPRSTDYMIARFLHFNEEDDATDILQFLPAEKRGSVLAKMQPDKRAKIEKLLTFGSETAGGLMDLNFLTVEKGLTLKNIIQIAMTHTEIQKQPPVVIVVDEGKRPMGFIPYRNLIFKSGDMRATDLVKTVPMIPSDTDRERILEIIMAKKSEVACVVDAIGQVLGVIHLADLLKVAEAEATEDVLLFAGVDTEEDPVDPIASKVRHRHRWLIVNLGTAFISSLVVSQFQESINTLTLLAVYMPMVAGLGGNTATQALAVAVRGLSSGEIGWSQAKMIIAKEAAAGMVNGAIVGTIAALGAIALDASPLFGAILGSSIILNLLIAGFFGSLMPFILKRLHIDPATASSIFVTAATDVFGFLAFLGLGTLFLM